MPKNNPKKLTVLLIEDDAGDVLLTHKAIERSETLSQLHVVRDGKEGLDYLRKEGDYATALTPDIILLDINMPRITGIELLKILKAEEKIRQIPVIILSTSSSEKDIKACYENHANCYITKPIDFMKFAEVINFTCKYWGAIASLPSEVL